MLIVALTTAEAIQIVGVLLVFALMVAPAATALRLTRRLASGIALSVGLAVGIAWLSLVLAYFTDWPTSFWITALGGLAYALSLLPGWLSARRTALAAA
jgi:zinc/manganese transport system permease protein